MNPIQQGISQPREDKLFTHASPIDLLQQLAAEVKVVAVQWRRDRWFFLGPQRTLTRPAPPPGCVWSDPASAEQQAGMQIKHLVIGSKVLVSRRAPGLSAQIRVRWIPDPRRPKNTACYLLLDFCQYPLVTEDELRQAAEAPTLVDPPPEDYGSADYASLTVWKAVDEASWKRWQDAVQANALAWEAANPRVQAQRELHQRLWTPLKKTTVRIWLDHARNPYQAIRWVPQELRERGRALAQWRAALLDMERRVRRRRLAAGEKPYAWNWLCISPQSYLDDITFQLLVYLLQEQMIELTSEISSFLKRHMRQFKHATSEEERALLSERFQLDGGGSGFAEILRKYAYPEHWKGGRQYIARTLHGRWASDARDAAKQSPNWSPLSAEEAEAVRLEKSGGRPWKPKRPILASSGTGGPRLYSIDEVVKILEAEVDEDQWTPKRGALYDWIKAWKIPATLDQWGRKGLDDDGVARARELIQPRREREAMMACLVAKGEAKGNKNPKAAAKKTLQPSRRHGKSLRDLALALMRGDES